jgi:hypothetical protein
MKNIITTFVKRNKYPKPKFERTEYGLRLDLIRAKYAEKNPDFTEIIKAHSRLMGELYVIQKPENIVKECPVLKKIAKKWVDTLDQEKSS